MRNIASILILSAVGLGVVANAQAESDAHSVISTTKKVAKDSADTHNKDLDDEAKQLDSDSDSSKVTSGSDSDPYDQYNLERDGLNPNRDAAPEPDE